MASKAHGRRYAQAVFEIALEKKELDRWQADLTGIAVLGKDTSLAFVMENPRVSYEDKVKLLSETLKDLNPLARNLIHLLICKGRFNLLPDIAEEYQRLLDNYRGIGKADVTTALPIEDKDKQKLVELLSAIFDKKIVVETAVDPGLIGGMVARVNGKLIDGSTRSKLAALKDELAGTRA